MGWENRSGRLYYYRKEREGSRVKSVYVGRGEIAHMVSQFQKSSAIVERLTRAQTIESFESQKAEAALSQAVELIQLFTHATLLTAGFHTHHRQWRRKRNVGSD
jgi:hypothetical protein